MKIDAGTARLMLKLIVAIPALIELGRRGAAAGRAIVDATKGKQQPGEAIGGELSSSR